MSLHRRGFVSGSLTAGLAAIASSAGGSHASADDSARADDQPGKTPHTRFAVNVEMWWTQLPFEQRIREAAKLGFPAVEFWPYEGKDLPGIASLCQDLGLEIAQFTAWGFRPRMNNPANEQAVLKKVKEACAVAQQINCKKMTVVAGDVTDGMTQEEMLAQVTRVLKLAAPILEDQEVMAILEPMNERVDHPGHCLYGSQDALQICRDVDSPMVKINWDLYHMQITEGDLCGHLKEGFDQIGYLQLADHPGRHEPGTGEIHYNRVLQAAYELGYRDFVGLECRPLEGERQAAERVAAADIW